MHSDRVNRISRCLALKKQTKKQKTPQQLLKNEGMKLLTAYHLVIQLKEKVMQSHDPKQFEESDSKVMF